MAVTDIEINATAEQLEAAALAEKWDREKIFEAVHPKGSVLFFPVELTSDYLNTLFGTTDTVWELWATFEGSEGTAVYGYRRLR